MHKKHKPDFVYLEQMIVENYYTPGALYTIQRPINTSHYATSYRIINSLVGEGGIYYLNISDDKIVVYIKPCINNLYEGICLHDKELIAVPYVRLIRL